MLPGLNFLWVSYFFLLVIKNLEIASLLTFMSQGHPGLHGKTLSKMGVEYERKGEGERK